MSEAVGGEAEVGEAVEHGEYTAKTPEDSSVIVNEGNIQGKEANEGVEETPLTKRKAQNRAAQRAFRERRAARVLELETSVKELQNMVNGLKQKHLEEMQLVMQENEEIKQKNEMLQRELVYLKSEFEKKLGYGHFGVQQTVSVPKGDFSNPGYMNRMGMDMREFPSAMIGQTVPLKRIMDSEKRENIQLKSLNPSDRSFKNVDSMQYMESKDFSMNSNYTNYQKKIDMNDQNQTGTDMPFSVPFVPRNDTIFHGNDCGFCTGNPDICLCVQTQNVNNKMGNMLGIDKDSILPPILIDNNHVNDQVEEKTLRDTRKTMEKLEILEPSSYTIQNEYEPGSCPQCKADSLSMLFCKTLASKINNNGAPVNCCLSDEKKHSYYNTDTNNSLCSSNNFLPCSTAYKTLSQHQKFVKENFGIIINNLAPGTRGMQIQADKVQETLRLLDQ
ncbi:uncharacterized protein T551_00137 [Pneumocystis jirovecii RU7]|uniref:BZIP domain-containing protein n=1 Tax=Pneumocystis jirovecii (strain RU7) TaxID=1408657 RepID=A0A0W4ZWB8_PNEJ7|nr:uncharacterized protein T551_00137 [Pneumocystis jirovecii RU7]KTW32652.1 hypothetical protein T551_00137 [Pneumocystis jirovecii RU7]